ncbi:MAG TPA: VPLPA-CTERM sorting domain-containing protein [Parasulfuritortus sp.]
MSKLLNVMLAVGLSMAASSSMASTVNMGTLNPGGFLSGGGSFTSNIADLYFNLSGGTGNFLTYLSADSNSNGMTSATLWNYDGNVKGSQISTLIQSPTGKANPATTFDISTYLATGHTYLLELGGKAGAGYSYFVSAVPLPAAGLLFGTALLGAAGLGRKKRVAEQADAVAA